MCNSRFIVLFLVAAMMLALPAASSAQVSLSITIAPPMLPVYSQPMCPAPNYMWTPGYWAYGPYGYFWVPGTWVQPPQIGFLWTPGYWGWGGGGYAWNAGYWGPQIGFYGGVAYGFGYNGVGYDGGYWRGRDFYYNRHVTNVNSHINRHVYDGPVVNRDHNRVSYNGGHGGIVARPNREQDTAAREKHTPPTSVQMQHEQGASRNREFQASVNHGTPAVAATAKPGIFDGASPSKNEEHPNHAQPASKMERKAEPNVGHSNNAKPAPKVERKAEPNVGHPNNAKPAPMMEHKAAPTMGHPDKTQASPKVEHKAEPNAAQPNHSKSAPSDEQKKNEKHNG
jgi:hypothetical protein